MKYIITKQIAVDAESPEDAVAKIETGKTVSFTVVERPQQGQGQLIAGQPMPVGRPAMGPVLTPPPANP